MLLSWPNCPVTSQKLVAFWKQTVCHLESERTWAISPIQGRRHKHSISTPESRPRCGGWP